jgi:hypothetical protein
MKIENTKGLRDDLKVKCLIFGAPGMGKTSLANTLEKGKVLSISSEDGLLSLNDSSIDYTNINVDDDGNVLTVADKVNRLGHVCKSLREDEKLKKKYDYIFIDSMTDISNLFEQHLDNVNKDNTNRYAKWDDYKRMFGAFLLGFRNLTDYHVFFTALNIRDKDEKSASFGAWLPDIVGQYGKSFSERSLDEIFYYSFDSEGERALITGSTKANLAKDRSGKLELKEKPDLQAILNKIKGEKK